MTNPKDMTDANLAYIERSLEEGLRRLDPEIFGPQVEEMKQVLKAVKDEIKSREQRQKVYENRGLAYDIAKRYGKGSRIPYEDRVQAGIVGLVYAVRGYDPSRGLFAAYAGRAIRRAIRDEIEDSGLVRVPQYLFRKGRHASPECVEAATRARKQPKDVGLCALVSRDPDPADACERSDLVQVIIERMDKLPAKCRQAVEAIVFPDRSDAEIAAELGISKSNFQSQRQCGLARLRSLMAGELRGN